MNTIVNPAHYTPSHDVKSGGVIKYNKNPLKGFLDKDKDGQVKRASLGGSALLTLGYLLVLAKTAKKGNFKVKDMFNIDFKNMFKVMGLATTAVVGGLLGGIAVDTKENRKAKLKESIHQFLGNVVTPITIVGLAGEAIEKRKFSKVKEVCLSALAAVGGVAAGVTGGNYVAGKVNKAIFKEEDNRKLGFKDFGIHVDDLLTVAALTPIGDQIKGFISKALPAIFLICGYQAGTKTANDDLKK